MRSDDGRPRPRWLIWTIVAGAVALVTIAGVGFLLVMSHRVTTAAKSPGSSMNALSAIDRLRSNLPAQLKAAQECVAISPPISYAAATITCTWNHSNVPHTATYSLFDSGANMLRSARSRVRDSGYGPSCGSAGDFSTGGGKMTWQHEKRDRGTIWCYANDTGDPVVQWTDTTANILTSAIAAGQQNAGPLLDWFLTAGRAAVEPAPAGPHPSPQSAGPASPSAGPASPSASPASPSAGPAGTKTPAPPASLTPSAPSRPNPPLGGAGSPMQAPPQMSNAPGQPASPVAPMPPAPPVQPMPNPPLGGAESPMQPPPPRGPFPQGS